MVQIQQDALLTPAADIYNDLDATRIGVVSFARRDLGDAVVDGRLLLVKAGFHLEGDQNRERYFPDPSVHSPW